MPRYVALLRGVSPLNAKMPELRQCFEAIGLDDVRTLLSSGNVAFSSRSSSESNLARKIEDALEVHLGRSFKTFVRSASYLQDLVNSKPFDAFALAAGSKRVVTFLPASPQAVPLLPIEFHGACIHGVRGPEVFCSYVPNPKSPAFMSLLERTFGKNITTRTLATVEKCAWA